MDDKNRGTLHRPKRWYLWPITAGFLIMVMLAFFFVYPREQIGPEQPIPFSHRVHAGVKLIDCRFCHSYVDVSQEAGLPAMEKCFFCHSYVIPLHPEIVREMTYYKEGVPVPWVKIYWVPDFVQFRHQPHIVLGKLQCEECHGNVRTMDRLERVDFKMGFCIDCHRKRNAQIDCYLACHH